jgi:hypothetical protein
MAIVYPTRALARGLQYVELRPVHCGRLPNNMIEMEGAT